ncbi:MAG: hypothetical protein INQ03_07250 [Candidatus Heimdallarchaeota archaeon]|nr:hypothetical protein [Candidatus Heimdallarchaeota archaeon]
MKNNSVCEKESNIIDFWTIIFSLYNIVSIEISFEYCKLSVVKKIKKNSDESTQKDIIGEFITIIENHFDNLLEHQTYAINLSLYSNLRRERKFYFNPLTKEYYHFLSFSSISIKSNFLSSLNALLETKDTILQFSQERIDESPKFYLNIILKSTTSENLNKRIKDTLEFLKINPNISGIIHQNCTQITHNPGRFLLGLMKQGVSENVLKPILSSISNQLLSNEKKSFHQNIYSWLGFYSRNEHCVSILKSIGKIMEYFGYLCIDEKKRLIATKQSIKFEIYYYPCLPLLIPEFLQNSSNRIMIIYRNSAISQEWKNTTYDLISFQEFQHLEKILQ